MTQPRAARAQRGWAGRRALENGRREGEMARGWCRRVGTPEKNMAEISVLTFTAIFLLVSGEEHKAGSKKKGRKGRKEKKKKVSKPRKSVLIAYECLCLKNYRIDFVVLFFDSLSVTFF